MHLAEGYYLFPKVFDGASDEINSIVNYQKSVMDIVAMLKFYFRILCVMLLYVKINLRFLGIGINQSRYAIFTFVKCFQYAVIYEIINKYNAVGSLTY